MIKKILKKIQRRRFLKSFDKTYNTEPTNEMPKPEYLNALREFSAYEVAKETKVLIKDANKLIDKLRKEGF